MSEKPRPQAAQDLIDSGYGTWSERTDPESGITTGFHFLSLDEMEAMGEEERIRLGVQATYLFALEHTPPPQDAE
jgi:hypothetical protein